MTEDILIHFDDSVQRRMRPAGFLIQGGWANGYVGVPINHPWYEKDYDSINASVHGGLTYSGFNEEYGKGLWWVGFDTMHAYDNLTTCSEAYVRNEADNLKNQAIAVIPEIAITDHWDPDNRNIQLDL